LRGIREASRAFAFPTYFFSAFLVAIIIFGFIKVAMGTLPSLPLHPHGAVPLGHPGTGIFAGAGLFFILQAYANGGSALTGLEAISNGVSAFRPPEGLNARKVLVVMSTTLGFLVLGVSVLAHFTHAIPYLSGAPTVISQEAKLVLGGGLGVIPYYFFQLASLLILWTGANTSFNGFPFLASFVAEDSFLPRQLMKRGHRLVFSNGIIVLAVVAIVLLVATGSSVDFLISFYAIGVFTGFTMAGAGMVKHHLDHREGRWRLKLAVNGSAACVAGAVVLIFASTKFLQGAWVVVVAFPILLWLLIRLNRQYRRERERLENGAERAAQARALRRHVVLVFVDRLDLAAARALQYARTIDPDEVRAVHFVLDDLASEHLRQQWEHLGLPKNVTLELRNCPSRRLLRDSVQLVAAEVVDGQTEVSVLLPRRAYSAGWSRLLHDRTADRIAGQVSRLPHANATIVPFQVEEEPLVGRRPLERPAQAPRKRARPGPGNGPRDGRAGRDEPLRIPGTMPISDVKWRHRATVGGQVQSVEVQPWGDSPRLAVTVVDGSGGLTLVFTRRDVAGVGTGTRLVAEGMVSQTQGRLAMLNPLVKLLPPEEDDVCGDEPA
ncbi:MAG: DNA-binding protein, partial [Acidimicrobiales bacterium]